MPNTTILGIQLWMKLQQVPKHLLTAMVPILPTSAGVERSPSTPQNLSQHYQEASRTDQRQHTRHSLSKVFYNLNCNPPTLLLWFM